MTMILNVPKRENLTIAKLDRMVCFLPFLVLLIFVMGRFFIQTNTDVNWTLIINERWFDGEKPYIDFYEFSPPATFLLFTPAVAFARVFGLSSDFGLAVEVCVCLAVCLFLGARLIKPAMTLTPTQSCWLLSFSLAVLLIMPAANFGQREHFATILALPLLASITCALARQKPNPKAAIIAGVLAGLAICIKPNFALFFMLPMLWLLWTSGWRVILRQLEFYAILIPICVYLISLPLFFAIYLEKILPVLVQIYLPAHRGFLDFTLLSPLFMGFLIGAFLLWFYQRPNNFFSKLPLCFVMFLASLGGFASYVIQHKGYPYQLIPAISFLLMAYGLFLISHPFFANDNQKAKVDNAGITVIATIGVAIFITFMRLLLVLPQLPDVKVDLSRYGSRPTMMQIGTEFLGTQLVHKLHGRWVGSVQAQWITFNGMLQQHFGKPDAEQKAKIAKILDYDKALALKDLTTRKPDILFVGEYDETVASPDDPSAQFWQKRWLGEEGFKAVLANYTICQFDHGVTIYCRNVP